jgi:hypothetical protein
MNTAKKFIISVAAFIFLAVCGIVIATNWTRFSAMFTGDPLYSVNDIDVVVDTGRDDGQHYKDYLDRLLEELENKISGDNSGDDFTFDEGVLEDLFDNLAGQNSNVLDLLNLKLDMLNNFIVLYTDKLSSLMLQLENVQSSIDELAGIGGDTSALEYANEYILSEIASCENIISALNGQIEQVQAELDAL